MVSLAYLVKHPTVNGKNRVRSPEYTPEKGISPLSKLILGFVFLFNFYSYNTKKFFSWYILHKLVEIAKTFEDSHIWIPLDSYIIQDILVT